MRPYFGYDPAAAYLLAFIMIAGTSCFLLGSAHWLADCRWSGTKGGERFYKKAATEPGCRSSPMTPSEGLRPPFNCKRVAPGDGPCRLVERIPLAILSLLVLAQARVIGFVAKAQMTVSNDRCALVSGIWPLRTIPCVASPAIA